MGREPGLAVAPSNRLQVAKDIAAWRVLSDRNLSAAAEPGAGCRQHNVGRIHPTAGIGKPGRRNPGHSLPLGGGRRAVDSTVLYDIQIHAVQDHPTHERGDSPIANCRVGFAIKEFPCRICAAVGTQVEVERIIWREHKTGDVKCAGSRICQ